MGQRFQILISTPPYFVNDNNPNNKGRQWFVYHSQWMYGATAVCFARHLLDALHIQFAGHEGKIIKAYEYERGLRESIDYARMQFFPHQPHVSDMFDTNSNMSILTCKTWGEYLQRKDNNNGFLFVYITDDDKITYTFCNLPDTENATFTGFIDAEKYLLGYYQKEKWGEVQPSPIRSIEILQQYPLCTDISLDDNPSIIVPAMRLDHYSGDAVIKSWCLSAKTEKGAIAKVKKNVRWTMKEKKPFDYITIKVEPTYTWEGVTFKR